MTKQKNMPIKQWKMCFAFNTIIGAFVFWTYQNLFILNLHYSQLMKRGNNTKSHFKIWTYGLVEIKQVSFTPLFNQEIKLWLQKKKKLLNNTTHDFLLPTQITDSVFRLKGKTNKQKPQISIFPSEQHGFIENVFWICGTSIISQHGLQCSQM